MKNESGMVFKNSSFGMVLNLMVAWTSRYLFLKNAIVAMARLWWLWIITWYSWTSLSMLWVGYECYDILLMSQTLGCMLQRVWSAGADLLSTLQQMLFRNWFSFIFSSSSAIIASEFMKIVRKKFPFMPVFTSAAIPFTAKWTTRWLWYILYCAYTRNSFASAHNFECFVVTTFRNIALA